MITKTLKVISQIPKTNAFLKKTDFQWTMRKTILSKFLLNQKWFPSPYHRKLVFGIILFSEFFCTLFKDLHTFKTGRFYYYLDKENILPFKICRANIYLLKVTNRNTRKRSEICSKLIIKTRE